MDNPVETTDTTTISPGSEVLQIANPMVPEQPAYMQDGFGNPRYLGHTSTFSFSRQLLSIVHQHPHLGDATPTPLNFDAEAYAVNATSRHVPADAYTALPSLEVASFYVQVLKFKTNPFFYLFDESVFMAQMHHFYESLTDTPLTNRIWYVHYLLIMAFGKALSTQSRFGCIEGLDLFDRALRLLPDASILWEDPLTATEVLCCVGLYLYSIDHRSAGYMYVSSLRCLRPGSHADHFTGRLVKPSDSHSLKASTLTYRMGFLDVTMPAEGDRFGGQYTAWIGAYQRA